MPLTHFVLGLPRSATTYVYKRLYTALKQKTDVIGVFEPTNHEVVGHIVKGVKHVHDTEGDVPYDYHRLPRQLLDMIYRNTAWHLEWEKNEHPEQPFLGRDFWKIMALLDKLDKPVLVKDVHAWVEAYYLTTAFPTTKFILTLPDQDTWVERMVKRLQVASNPLDKAGITKFVRYFLQGHYVRSVSPEAVRVEARAVYWAYRTIVEMIRGRPNVYILDYTGRIPAEKEAEMLRWALG